MTQALSLLEFVPAVEDFPKPGIVFRDIAPLLADARAFRTALDMMIAQCEHWSFDYFAGIESRGLIFAAALGALTGRGILLVRKAGKLPVATVSERYGLEYGTDCLEMAPSHVKAGSRMIIVDDVIATGGTLLATTRLVKRLECEVAGILSLLELEALGGGAALRGQGFAVKSVLRA